MYFYCWNSLSFCGMVSTESFLYNWTDHYSKYRKGSICNILILLTLFKVILSFSFIPSKITKSHTRGGDSDVGNKGQSQNMNLANKGSCTYYVITDRGGGVSPNDYSITYIGVVRQMITVLHRGDLADDYGIP